MDDLYSRTVAARRIAAACGVGVLLFGATACGSKGNDTNDAATSTSGSGPQTSQQNGPNGGRFPGASGKVAQVDGSTAQVQSQQNGQVAVTWTGTTTFTKEVSARLSDIKVGDCVVAMPDQSSAGSSTSSDDTTVTAATVRITSTSGSCTSGFRAGPGGANGQGPSFDGTPPSGAPSGLPSGAPAGGRFRGSFGAVGKVTAVSGTGFTVSSTLPDFNGSGSSDGSTRTVSVTTTGSTKFTTTAKASSSDVKVGACMTAQGTTDDTGAVTARTVALSAAVDGECGGGFFRSRSTGQES